jgi:hypothetical protein
MERRRGDLMSEARGLEAEPGVLHLLIDGEALNLETRTRDGVLAVTDRRVVVAGANRVALDIPYAKLRRVQLDVERGVMATVVLVPDDPGYEPQVLQIPAEELVQTATAVALIGQRL